MKQEELIAIGSGILAFGVGRVYGGFYIKEASGNIKDAGLQKRISDSNKGGLIQIGLGLAVVIYAFAKKQ